MVDALTTDRKTHDLNAVEYNWPTGSQQPDGHSVKYDGLVRDWCWAPEDIEVRNDDLQKVRQGDLAERGAMARTGFFFTFDTAPRPPLSSTLGHRSWRQTGDQAIPMGVGGTTSSHRRQPQVGQVHTVRAEAAVGRRKLGSRCLGPDVPRRWCPIRGTGGGTP
jgi:hypothetical protein